LDRKHIISDTSCSCYSTNISILPPTVDMGYSENETNPQFTYQIMQ